MESSAKDLYHNHNHKSIFVEGSAKLSDDEHHTKLTMNLRGLYSKMMKVDEWVFLMPVKPGTTKPILMVVL